MRGEPGKNVEIAEEAYPDGRVRDDRSEAGPWGGLHKEDPLSVKGERLLHPDEG